MMNAANKAYVKLKTIIDNYHCQSGCEKTVNIQTDSLPFSPECNKAPTPKYPKRVTFTLAGTGTVSCIGKPSAKQYEITYTVKICLRCDNTQSQQTSPSTQD